MSNRNKIKWHKLAEKKGDNTAYESYVLKAGQDEDGVPIEDVRANPDSLAFIERGITRPEEIMGEAIEHLQGRQKDVYMLTIRQGLSLDKAAKLLSISKSAAQIYKDRAIKFITAYCQNKMAKEDK